MEASKPQRRQTTFSPGSHYSLVLDLRMHEIQLAFGLKYMKAIRIPPGAKTLHNAVICLSNANILV